MLFDSNRCGYDSETIYDLHNHRQHCMESCKNNVLATECDAFYRKKVLRNRKLKFSKFKILALMEPLCEKIV